MDSRLLSTANYYVYISSNFYCYCYCYCYRYPSMIIHRKPSSSSSASAASATAKIETHASQPPHQKEHRNDNEDETSTRQGIFDLREEVEGGFDYTSTTIKVKGKGSTATATHDVSEREKSSMKMRSESILSWLGVWGIVAVYLFLSKVISASTARKEGLNTFSCKLKKAFVSSEIMIVAGNFVASFAEYAFVPDRRIYLPEVIKSINTFIMLQRVMIKYEYTQKKAFKPKRNTWANVDKSSVEVEELAYYSSFATAAYGWLCTLFLTGRFYFGNDVSLMKTTKVEKDDVIMTNWQAKTYQPAFYVVKDKERKAFVLCVRGCFSPADFFTCYSPKFAKAKFQPSSDLKLQLNITNVERHAGLVASALYVSEMTVNTITDELKHNPTYSLVIVGHSMGGGVAAILGSMWKQRFKNRVKSITYGCPRYFSADDDNYDNVVSVVHEDDPLMRSCFGNYIAVRDAVWELRLDKHFQAEIMQRTSLMLKSSTISKEDYIWCRKARSSLSQVSNEVVPGTVRLLCNDGHFRGTRFHPDEFKQWDLHLHPKTLDFSPHYTTRYQADLQRIVSSHDELVKVK